MLIATPVDEAEQYRRAVTRYIRYLIRDSAEAEDLAQIKPDGTGLKQVTNNTLDNSFERSID